MHTNESRQQLRELMAQQIALLSDLEDSLAMESEALKQRNSADLSKTTQYKESLLQEIDLVGSELSRLVEKCGQKPTNAGIKICSDTPDLRLLWKTLRQKLESCNHHNQINGGMIQVNRACNDRLVEILRGNSLTSPLYDTAGKIHHSNHHVHIAKA